MKDNEDRKWLDTLRYVMEGLLQATVMLENIGGDPNLTAPDAQQEVLEAIEQDVDRAFRAVTRILKCYNAMPDWATDAEQPPDEPPTTVLNEDIPF